MGSCASSACTLVCSAVTRFSGAALPSQHDPQFGERLVLQVAFVGLGENILLEIELLYVANDADDGHPITVRFGRAPLDTMSDRILPVKVAVGECLVDDDDARGLLRVGVVEEAAADQGNAERLEIIAEHDCMRIDVESSAGRWDLAFDAEDLLQPLSNGRSVPAPVDSIQERFEATHEFEVKRPLPPVLFVPGVGKRNHSGDDVGGLESRIDLQHTLEAAYEKTGANQQHECE